MKVGLEEEFALMDLVTQLLSVALDVSHFLLMEFLLDPRQLQLLIAVLVVHIDIDVCESDEFKSGEGCNKARSSKQARTKQAGKNETSLTLECNAFFPHGHGTLAFLYLT